MRRPTIVIALASAVLTCAATGLHAQETTKKKAASKEGGAMRKMVMQAGPPITRAVAVLHATKSGGNAAGKVVFTRVEGGVKVVAEVRGLTPGQHGFHIHEWGDTSSPDAMSAGSHYDPAMTKHHGSPTSDPRHAGDLGNLEANASGLAVLEIVVPGMSFGGPRSIIGRGVIVHEKADDFGQPVGNAGGRVAAGVIGIAKPE